MNFSCKMYFLVIFALENVKTWFHSNLIIQKMSSRPYIFICIFPFSNKLSTKYHFEKKSWWHFTWIATQPGRGQYIYYDYLPLAMLVPIYTPGWRETPRGKRVLSKDTTRPPGLGIKLGPLKLKSDSPNTKVFVISLSMPVLKATWRVKHYKVQKIQAYCTIF